ncbi:bone morphogenetic protein 8A, partial [Leptonychotes weddellii]|uniref:Bone morphogenetic protein 8A n=1 Tax=Leptonychotes weddellii TaxID=9713 RepID=A0A7F8RX99_LEPWE
PAAPLHLAVERDRTLGHQEPHWKEFRFDLTQIPEGEAVTAAEFRIYKLASAHLLNRTLHVSMFQVVREQSNRESDLFFLDLQTLRAGDEGWLVLDVTTASDRWLLSRNKDLGLRLYVETEDEPTFQSLRGSPHCPSPRAAVWGGAHFRTGQGQGEMGKATCSRLCPRPRQVHLMKPDAVPKACCAPTKLSATSVLYYDSSNNVILRKHRNMVVRACGCH